MWRKHVYGGMRVSYESFVVVFSYIYATVVGCLKASNLDSYTQHGNNKNIHFMFKLHRTAPHGIVSISFRLIHIQSITNVIFRCLLGTGTWIIDAFVHKMNPVTLFYKFYMQRLYS